MTYKEDRVPLVGLNCATCHTGTVRETPTSPRQIILGMPAHQMDLQGFANFLTEAARDSRFNASTLIDAIRTQDESFSFFNALVYRFLVIRRTRDGILERAVTNAWFADRPPQGPGRVDTFDPYKAPFGFDMKSDPTVGTADLPPLFNQRVRASMWLHWDGNTNAVEENGTRAAPARPRTRSTCPLWTASRNGSSICRRRGSRRTASIGAAPRRALRSIRLPARGVTIPVATRSGR